MLLHRIQTLVHWLGHNDARDDLWKTVLCRQKRNSNGSLKSTIRSIATPFSLTPFSTTPSSTPRSTPRTNAISTTAISTTPRTTPRTNAIKITPRTTPRTTHRTTHRPTASSRPVRYTVNANV